jgi:hypothetical protein
MLTKNERRLLSNASSIIQRELGNSSGNEVRLPGFGKFTTVNTTVRRVTPSNPGVNGEWEGTYVKFHAYDSYRHRIRNLQPVNPYRPRIVVRPAPTPSWAT